MSPLSRFLAFVFVFTAVALPVRAGTIPKVSTVYALALKGDCYSITTNATGPATVKYLRSFQQTGRLQVTPRVVTAGTTNGANIRDAAFLVDHGTIGRGGVGALQYVTNESLFRFVSAGVYPAKDFAYVTSNAAATVITITHDKTQITTENSFKIDDSLLSLPYTVKGATITINFLANGRVS